MPVASSSEQIFAGSNQQWSGRSYPPIESATMLLSVLKERLLEKYNEFSTHQLEEQWRSFLKSSWANHWLPEVRYLRGWTLSEFALLVVIGLLTCSWYTIRNDRKDREVQNKHAVKQLVQQSKTKNLNLDNSDKPQQQQEHNWLRYRNLPTLDVGALGFSAGTSWERRYQTMAMFSCSLAFVLPGTCICWALVAHFGALLPLHVFVWKDYDYDVGENDDTIPRFYQFRTIVFAGFVWFYLLYMFLFDSSPTYGNRKPVMRNWFRDWWNHACDFLPVVLVKTADLPAVTTISSTTESGETITTTAPARYVMGYHPHGIIAVGAFCAFATDGARVLDLSDKNNSSKQNQESNTKNKGSSNSNNTAANSSKSAAPMGLPLRPSSLSLLDDVNDKLTPLTSPSVTRGFSSLFPNLDRRIVTLPVNFGTPFLRDYLLAMGAVTSEKATFRNYLNPNHTNSRAMVVVVGGAAESMLAHEGHIELVLKHRRGFVREAILAKASLVPVLGFGAYISAIVYIVPWLRGCVVVYDTTYLHNQKL